MTENGHGLTSRASSLREASERGLPLDAERGIMLQLTIRDGMANEPTQHVRQREPSARPIRIGFQNSGDDALAGEARDRAMPVLPSKGSMRLAQLIFVVPLRPTYSALHMYDAMGAAIVPALHDPMPIRIDAWGHGQSGLLFLLVLLPAGVQETLLSLVPGHVMWRRHQRQNRGCYRDQLCSRRAFEWTLEPELQAMRQPVPTTCSDLRRSHSWFR
jgi:hypothetical protein